MNLLRIQDALKNASDDQLMQLMQSPDSTAPSYLVLTEIRRRKDMRAKQGEEPETTVAEDLSSPEQTYNEDGIRSLRTPGYEQEERAAEDRSGISAMREGGVVRMRDGGLPPRLEDFYTGRPLSELNESELRALAGPQAAMSVPQPGRLRFPGLAPNPLMASIPEDQRNILSSEARMELARRQPASRNYSAMGPEPAMTEAEMALSPPASPPPASPPPDQTNPNAAPPPANPPGSPPAGPAAGPATGGAAAGRGGAGGGGGGLGDLRDYIRRLEDVFPNPAAGMAAELEKARTNPGERRREAQNLALIEAGLRMMGNKNPSFLGAVGEAATPTVQTYAQQLGEIRKDARQDIRDRFELAKTEVNRQWMMGQIGAAEYRTRMQEIGAAQRHAATEAGANARLQTQEANRVAAADREEARAIAASQRAAQQSLNQALGNDRLRAAIREEIASERPRGDRSPVTNEEINRRIMGLGFRGLGPQQGGEANYNFNPNAPGAGLVPNR